MCIAKHIAQQVIVRSIGAQESFSRSSVRRALESGLRAAFVASMGMHFGIVAACAPWRLALGALRELTGDFLERGMVHYIGDWDLRTARQGFSVVGGEFESKSYLLDSSMLLATDFDLLVDLSRKLRSIVVGCCAETLSGSYFWTSADCGVVSRLYGVCRSAIQQPFQVGGPLATESEFPLEDSDGTGFMRALRHLGFCYSGWTSRGSKTACRYQGRARDAGFARPLKDAFENHWKTFEIVEFNPSKPMVVSRRLKNGSIVYDILSDASKTSVVGLMRSLFHPRRES